jgi:hypothetical protein
MFPQGLRCQILRFFICAILGQTPMPFTACTPVFLKFQKKKGVANMYRTKKIKNIFSNSPSYGPFDLYTLFQPMQRGVKS